MKKPDLGGELTPEEIAEAKGLTPPEPEPEEDGLSDDEAAEQEDSESEPEDAPEVHFQTFQESYQDLANQIPRAAVIHDFLQFAQGASGMTARVDAIISCGWEGEDGDSESIRSALLEVQNALVLIYKRSVACAGLLAPRKRT